ncbi:hypothetical protein POTOM_049750 [Populus tomentosa]|uniref:Uncharacterized protein n=1 Tax=Populus tomentosa TaxID=118781 RepID=A0A8X7YF11_POPTO|nr:hypothetical protein POTOM_049750 [Populus tomentosa]
MKREGQMGTYITVAKDVYLAALEEDWDRMIRACSGSSLSAAKGDGDQSRSKKGWPVVERIQKDKHKHESALKLAQELIKKNQRKWWQSIKVKPTKVNIETPGQGGSGGQSERQGGRGIPGEGGEGQEGAREGVDTGRGGGGERVQKVVPPSLSEQRAREGQKKMIGILKKYLFASICVWRPAIVFNAPFPLRLEADFPPPLFEVDALQLGSFHSSRAEESRNRRAWTFYSLIGASYYALASTLIKSRGIQKQDSYVVRPQYGVSQSSWTKRDANNKLGEEEKNRANVTLQAEPPSVPAARTEKVESPSAPAARTENM